MSVHRIHTRILSFTLSMHSEHMGWRQQAVCLASQLWSRQMAHLASLSPCRVWNAEGRVATWNLTASLPSKCTFTSCWPESRRTEWDLSMVS